MRKTILTLASAAALALPFIAFTPTTVGAATGTSCAAVSGKATFNPPLPPASSNNKVLSTIKSTGTIKNCSGGGVMSGTVTGTNKFSKPGNCKTLVQGSGGASHGTLTVKWNNGTTSSGPSTITQVSGHPTEANVTGTVKTGRFAGDKSSVQVSFTTSSAGGNCTTTPLKFVTFKNTSGHKLTIHP